MGVNALEKTANAVHMALRKSKSALILKIPVPIELTAKGLIVKKSTVDYSGTLYGGLSIDFDAKETLNKTSFPLSNIKEHQVHYLMYKYEIGGLAFFMVHFKNVHKDKVFITPISLVKTYWDNAIFNKGRKSIPITEFKSEWLTTVEDYINKVKEMVNELRTDIVPL